MDCFVCNFIGSSTIHPIYLSLPIIIPYYTKVNSNKTSLIAFKMEGIIGFPEKITKIHRPFCEGYYSLSQQIPIPIHQRISYSISPFLYDYGYHFSLTSQDVFDFDKNGQVLHISAEESITNQKHQFLSQQDILACSSFMLSMQFRSSNDPSVVGSEVHSFNHSIIIQSSLRIIQSFLRIIRSLNHSQSFLIITQRSRCTGT